MASRACRKPVYFVFVTAAFIAFIVMSFYAYTAANFGALCPDQYMGYTYAVVSNIVLMTAAFFAGLVMWGDEWLYKCVLFNITVNIMGFALSIVSICYFGKDCTKQSFKKYRFPRIGRENIGALDELQYEGHCCGLDDYKDYIVPNATEWRVPKSCCKPPEPKKPMMCGMTNMTADFPMGCIPGLKSFEDLKKSAPNFYFHNLIVKNLVIVTPIVYIIFIASLIYYLWKYGRPKYYHWLRSGRFPACLRDSCPCAPSQSKDEEDPDAEADGDALYDYAPNPRRSKHDLHSSDGSSELFVSRMDSDNLVEADSAEDTPEERSKERLVRFSETLVVYPYNAEDRFTPIPVDAEGNPLPPDRSCPARPGYRYTTAPLKRRGSRKPVPRCRPRSRPVIEEEEEMEPQKEESEQEMEPQRDPEREQETEAQEEEES